ncbi:MAG: DNA repair protein RecO [Candidatus Eisenbacteria bacterium]|uniref:DNA repair protein RecO n=1 Tax=Eiseniibacteriota bacterium TaxID=2212470 RepID=A0A938BRP5_UNCEI|nr:DNA repair protein RecO [Candidatus Eisenbacteria bacterium]
MAIVEDEALILRAMRYSDTSRIVIASARLGGIVRLLAKGSRDPKSPFGASLEPLTRSAIVYYRKRDRELHLLRSAMVVEPHLGLLRCTRAYHLAHAAAEFALRVVPGEEPNPEIHDLLLRYLAHLARLPGRPASAAVLKRLQLRIAALLGYEPRLGGCARCGGAAESPSGFGVAEGGLLCRRCRPEGERLALGVEALDRLRALASPERTPRPAAQLPPEAARQMERVIESFLRYHLPAYSGLRALKSLDDWTLLVGAGGEREAPAAT